LEKVKDDMAYLSEIISQLCIYIIEVAALDLLVGYVGILSFGHAAFIGVGAYASAIALTSLGLSLPVAVLASLAITAAIAIVVGLPTLRLSGDYFILGTLGLSIIASTVFQNWETTSNASW
jgi:branched-chain amino acid transport system permease protein